MDRFTPTEEFEIGSRRCFGIELETSSCPEYRSLRGLTIFGAKFDGSISGMEFISPILSGDAGIAVIEDFCSKANRMDFRVNSDCGYHLHIDMRDTSEDQRQAIAYAYRLTYELWAGFVNQYRAYDCRYCHAPAYSAYEVANVSDFDSWTNSCDRTEFINLTAFSRHNTYEIRGYEGTLNFREIRNWIKAHLFFVDYALDKTITELTALFARPWPMLRRIIGPDLARFYGRKRAERTQEDREKRQVHETWERVEV